MKNKQRKIQIPHEVLRRGYEKTVSNGFSLVRSAISLLENFPYIALGLSQLGQEEIGKSLSILAAFQLKNEEWQWFWNTWLDHKKKSQRAFLYELISPFRLEVYSKTNECLSGISKRESIPKEKEAAFYVSYNDPQKAFILPEEDIHTDEIINRTMTAAYLAKKAFFIYSTLEMSDVEFRYKSFSEIVLRICSENLYQHEMPKIFNEFRTRSDKHAAFINDLEKQKLQEKQFWDDYIKQ